MKLPIRPLIALLLVFSLTSTIGHAETGKKSELESSSVSENSPSVPNDSAPVLERSDDAGATRSISLIARDKRTFRPFTAVGFAVRGGTAGAGFDIATPLTPKFNLRAGFDYFRYGFDFQEEGANVNASFRMLSGHASLDWFPFGGRFRLSPTVVFANNNKVNATVLVPPGSTLTLNGVDYIGSATDPLHGSGTVTFRKTSPGLTLGFGNIIPRTRSHFSFPVEAGFYYVNQPRLKVDFSGSACDPNYSPDIGCESVTDDPGFQKDLAAFIARNNHNLSYASIFPIFSFGFGYTF